MTDTPLNLVWIGDPLPVYAFANYRGIKKLDIKRQDLLRSLESGEARWTEDLELPLMDRSYSAMIQKMQRDLVWQATHDPATGLANRKHFFRSIRRDWLRSPSRDSGCAIGVVQLDIGTPAGDAAASDIRLPILRDLAQMLPACHPARCSRAPANPLWHSGSQPPTVPPPRPRPRRWSASSPRSRRKSTASATASMRWPG